MLPEIQHNVHAEAMPGQVCNAVNNEVIDNNATGRSSPSLLSNEVFVLQHL